MKKLSMKKEYLIAIIMVLIIIAAPFILNNITGKAVGGPGGPPESASSSGGAGGFGGPSSESISCMQACTGCTSIEECNSENKEQCMAQCSVEPEPEPSSEGESCMQECILVGCDKFDFECQNKNREECDLKCFEQAPDESEMSAEQLCITNCVSAVDPNIRCGNSQTGETGGEVCQKCAADCVHLYAGPCLDDEKLSAKKKECETCAHCYGEPVMGDSGEGWECIVDVKCNDASSEFGDEPGTGPGIGQEGFVANVGETIGDVFEGIGNFFKGLFGGEESSE